jgi:hypothetical protein
VATRSNLGFWLAARNDRVRSSQSRTETDTSDSELRAVIQAVEDEIYDYGYQKKFYHMGENVADATRAARTSMRIYIDPEIDSTDESGASSTS